MALSEHVIALIEELDRGHPNGVVDWNVRKPRDFPNFVTAENGQVRLFTPLALKEIAAIANLLYDNDADWKAAAERQVFREQVRRCVANLHALIFLMTRRPTTRARRATEFVKGFTSNSRASQQRLFITFPAERRPSHLVTNSLWGQ